MGEGGAGWGERASDADTITWSRANYNAQMWPSYDVNPTSGYHPFFATGSYPYTSPVGYFAANGYGLHDMAGNVFEWCYDWYDVAYYSSSPGTDPRGPAYSPVGSHVLRGSSWLDGAQQARCADRFYYSPETPAYDLNGFRCARGF